MCSGSRPRKPPPPTPGNLLFAVSFHKPIQSDTCHALGKEVGETRNDPCVQLFWSVLSRLPRKLESGKADSEARQPGFDPSSPSLAV